MFRDSKYLALAAIAVTTCIQNSLGDRQHNTHRKTQEAHKSEHKTTKQTETEAIKWLDGFNRTSEKRQTTKHTKMHIL